MAIAFPLALWLYPGCYLRHSFHLGLFRVERVNHAAGTMTVVEVAERYAEPLLMALPRTERIGPWWREETVYPI